MDKIHRCLVIDATNIQAGGGVTHICELINASNPLNHGFNKVILWSSNSTLEKFPTKDWLELKSHPFLNFGLIFRFIWLFFIFPFALKKDKCSILFTPGGIDFSFFKPIVSMSQNLLPFEPLECKRYGWGFAYFRFIILKILQTKTFLHSNGIIFLTKFAQDVVIDSIGHIEGEKIIIPHGINSKFFFPPSARTYSTFREFDSTPCNLVYVSVVEIYKHQWNVVDAVNELRNSGWNLNLSLVGSRGSGSVLLDKCISRLNGDGSWLSVVESVDYREIQNVYKKANVGIFASSCETYGQIVTESMASSLPLVCSSLSSMKEILGENAYYFHPENIEEIKGSLLKLITSAESQEKFAINGNNIAKRLTWDNSAKLTFDFLNNICLNNK